MGLGRQDAEMLDEPGSFIYGVRNLANKQGLQSATYRPKQTRSRQPLTHRQFRLPGAALCDWLIYKNGAFEAGSCVWTRDGR